MLKKVTEGIKAASKKLKDPYWKAQCKYIKYYEKLPIRENVIFLQSYLGRKIDGNIFYILKYLLTDKKYSGYKIYITSWVRYQNTIREKLAQSGISDVNIVTYSSDEYMQLLASAKYLFNDFEFPKFFIKKPGQIYINTWHGTPLKTLGYAKSDNKYVLGNLQRNLIMADYLFNPNEFTNEVMIRDFFVENLSEGSYIIGGYPRNEIFFDTEARERVRRESDLEDKRVYAYLPTWREIVSPLQTQINNVTLAYYLWEIDKRLNDNEIMFVNVHPLAKDALSALKGQEFKHIRNFPDKYETYTFLNAADALLTDYSSVFFDFACTGKKTVLFPYDKEDYLRTRGMYFSMDELPFPQVFDVDSVVEELRSEKNYDDRELLNKFNRYDCPNASQKLCDYVILGKDTGLVTGKIPDNGKENILIYGGGLDNTALTDSLRALFNAVDLSKRNYYLSFREDYAKNNQSQIDTFNKDVKIFAMSVYNDMTAAERLTFKLFSKGKIKAGRCIRKLGKRFDEEYLRVFGNVRFDAIIHFTGYGAEPIIHFSRSVKNNMIFVHKDMTEEINKGKQRRDVLEYAYKNYSKVVTVSESLNKSVMSISGRSDNIFTVHNSFDTQKGKIAAKEPRFFTLCDYSDRDSLNNLIKAFNRLSDEIGTAYLILCDPKGSQKEQNELKNQMLSEEHENSIILLNGISNPSYMLDSSDFCIVTCFDAGVPQLLDDARALKKPIVSTRAEAVKDVLLEKKVTVISNSEESLYNSMSALYYGKPLYISDYRRKYNKKCAEEFERLFDTK